MQTEEPHLLQRIVGRDSELVLGLVGAVGTELDKIVNDLIARLKVFKYEACEVRISEQIIPQKTPKVDETEYQRITRGMNDGDAARKDSGDNAILALGAASWVSAQRSKDNQGQPERGPRKAYIIRSLKHPAEVTALRQIYPLGFYLIGVHSDKDRRRGFFIQQHEMTDVDADGLIARDENENLPWGQRVTDTFHLSDFFVRLEHDDDEVRHNLWRFLDVVFGDPYRTPTFDEYAMFLAFVSSMRSSSMARQVGAVVTKNNEILATGANDCPQFGGGLYWPQYNPNSKEIEDVKGGRDHTLGVDTNKAEQKEIIDEIVTEAAAKGIDEATLRKVLRESRISDLTEFGREVHAEMEALLACARNRVSSRDGTLYTTTFPCHNCAKHIIGGGIKRVVYIAPYQKSKAPDFHKDAMMVGFSDKDKQEKTAQFEPFVGFGPRHFLDFFSVQLGSGYPLRRRTKGDITVVNWKRESAQLRLQMLPISYLDYELAASNRFKELTQKGATTNGQ